MYQRAPRGSFKGVRAFEVEFGDFGFCGWSKPDTRRKHDPLSMEKNLHVAKGNVMKFSF